MREKAVKRNKEQQAYDAGYECHQSGGSSGECPYNMDGDDANLWDAWMNGFEQSENEVEYETFLGGSP